MICTSTRMHYASYSNRFLVGGTAVRQSVVLISGVNHYPHVGIPGQCDKYMKAHHSTDFGCSRPVRKPEHGWSLQEWGNRKAKTGPYIQLF